ncbi:MAG: hypothetical protein LBH03_01445 [Holophagales bacterium]|jgi:hypothetical protein|nr:hypothetical protein [Holophagales bacterium]
MSVPTKKQHRETMINREANEEWHTSSNRDITIRRRVAYHHSPPPDSVWSALTMVVRNLFAKN